MVTSQKHIDHDLGGSKKKTSWYWILFMFFILYIFSQTSPFNFNYPTIMAEGENFEGGTAGMIERSAAGNMKRRVGLICLASALAFSLARSRYRYQMNGPLAWMIVFYLAWILSSLMWSVDTMYTLRRLIVAFMMWGAAISLAAQLSWNQIVRLAVFVAGVTLFLGVGNEMKLGTFAPTNQGWRLGGVFHAVTMAWNISLFVLSTMYLVTTEKRPVIRNLLWGLVIIGMFFLFLTRTRTAMIACLLSAGFYWTFIVPSLKRVLFVLGIIIFVTAAYIFVGEQLGRVGGSAVTMGRGEAANKQVGNLTGRVPLWNYSFKFAAERPLHGYGYVTFLNKKNIDQIFKEIGWAPVSLHSAYVTELMGTGFVGLSAFVAVLVLSLIRAWRLAKQNPHMYYYVFAVIVWAVIINMLEAGLGFGMTFMTFYVMLLEAKLAFSAPEE